MPKLISVVLPVYNGANRVSKAVESVLQQNYREIELIIVNDCSTDNTQQVIQRYQELDNRIKIINNTENLKLPKSINRGFSESKGDYLTWTSDDNAYKTDALKKMAEYLDSHPEVDLVYCDFDIVELDGTYRQTIRTLEPDEMRFENAVGACFLYRRELAEKIGEYDPELFLAEDYEYWIRAYLNGTLHHIPEVLYEYGWHDKSLTVSKELQVRHKTFEAKNKHLAELLSRCISQDEKNRFYNTMLKHLVDDNERKRVKKQYYRLDKAYKKECYKQENKFSWNISFIKRIVYNCSLSWKKEIIKLEQKKIRGKYWIIKPDNPDTGLFSYFNLFLPQILMAEALGCTPVIDMQSVKTTYLEVEQVGEANAWEFFFAQPKGVGLNDIQIENVADKQCKPFRSGPYSGRAFYDDLYGDKTFWRRFVSREIKVRDSILKQTEDWWSNTFPSEDRVLGVLCRGTDYLRLKPTGHAKQPEPMQCVEKTKELMREWNCSRVYLSTEDKDILALFQRELPGVITFFEKEYVQDSGNGYVTQVHFDRAEDARKQGEEYLVQILILSKCTCLLAGPCGGTIGAELFTKGFEKEYIWDLGVYS